MRKAVVTDAGFFHTEEMMVPTPSHTEERGWGHTFSVLWYTQRTSMHTSSAALLLDTVYNWSLWNYSTKWAVKHWWKKCTSSLKKQEGHSYIFPHYFIMMETADSAGPHLHNFYRTGATSSAESRLKLHYGLMFAKFSFFYHNQDKWHTFWWLSHTVILRLHVREKLH